MAKKYEDMSDTEKFVAVTNALQVIGKIWQPGRTGLILSLNGVRVGIWKWTKSRMLVVADKGADKRFNKLLTKYKNEGIPVVSFVTKIDEENPVLEDDAKFVSNQATSISMTPLTNLTPGDLDTVLKAQGYFMLDYNLPVSAE